MALILVASLKEGKSANYRTASDMMDLTSRLVIETTGGTRAVVSETPVSAPASTPGPRNEPGLLQGEMIPPGESREGFLFFLMPGGWMNWEQARLERF